MEEISNNSRYKLNDAEPIDNVVMFRLLRFASAFSINFIRYLLLWCPHRRRSRRYGVYGGVFASSRSVFANEYTQDFSLNMKVRARAVNIVSK